MSGTVLHYDLPNPGFQRAIFTIAGLFALVICPYELWRGVWPLNITTPFFGFIMLGGMSVGAAFVWAGLGSPSGKLEFRPGLLEVERQFLFGARRTIVRAADIRSIDVIEDTNMEGPNDWHAVINVNGMKPLYSRPLSTKQAAERQAAEFRAALGL
ncbi:MAG: hypothetical protein WCC66_01800 [Rhizobiaceae bacterium]